MSFHLHLKIVSCKGWDEKKFFFAKISQNCFVFLRKTLRKCGNFVKAKIYFLKKYESLHCSQNNKKGQNTASLHFATKIDFIYFLIFSN